MRVKKWAVIARHAPLLVIARHVSAEAISHTPPRLPRLRLAMTGKEGLAMTAGKRARNDTPHYVIARHISDEAIPYLSSPLKGEVDPPAGLCYAQFGMPKNLEEGQRWLVQAQRDLTDAKVLLDAHSYASSCFHAQQAAEKAAKGFLYSRGIRAIVSHSVTRLINECATIDARFGDFEEAGKELDRHYIGSRYPNFYAEGTADEYYTQEMADRCIKYATSLLSNASRLLGS